MSLTIPQNTNGQATKANSAPVVIASDQGALVISSSDIGTTADVSATTDTGTFSLIALIKRLVSKIPVLGQAVMASSLPVTLASNQSAIPVSQSGTWTVMPGNTANTTAWLTNPLNPAVGTSGDTGAKTATFNGATQTNANSKGALIVLNVGAVTGTSPTLTVKVQVSADGGTNWLDLPNAITASITGSGLVGIKVYPGITPVASSGVGSIAEVSSVLSRTWRLVYTIGGTTPSFTLTNVQVSYII